MDNVPEEFGLFNPSIDHIEELTVLKFFPVFIARKRLDTRGPSAAAVWRGREALRNVGMASTATPILRITHVEGASPHGSPSFVSGGSSWDASFRETSGGKETRTNRPNTPRDWPCR